MPEDVFLTSPRKAPANRKSTASLRASPSSLAGALDGVGDDNAANGRFSLAHELAVAMMPEPSAGSKLLAEEFGIEFDEGAEGIDPPGSGGPQINVQDAGEGELSFATSESDPQLDASFEGNNSEPLLDDPSFASPTRAPQRERERERDAMEVLAADLASTDNFLAHLRRLDVDSAFPPSSSPSLSTFPTSPSASSSTFPSSKSLAESSPSTSQQPAIESLASTIIRRINDTARDREGQVRALLEYEREFRRIAGEVGGQDVLGRLDALPEAEAEEPPAVQSLDVIPDDPTVSPPIRPAHLRAFSQDWETDPDVDRLGDAEEPDTDPAFDGRGDEPVSPTRALTFSPTLSPSIPTAATPSQPKTGTSSTGATTLASLTALRTHTTSLVSSLTSLSEHAQVNGAGAAEAGRKLRALRNRLGGWRQEWEGAERSRGRIERWEGGASWSAASASASGDSTPVKDTPGGGGHTKRVDGRKVVAEHLQAFELALAEAAVKTKAIMAAS
ncbi:hypothetical protein MVEN_00952800 [Mycena venus]|uniref:Uncharacterized protein n=1 Tax=Mycena venus TaxID=2733690 RepID=A0A8H7CZD1_9AGAR|nr:hypothetical protein MVEN_00952800 [Mycena venus]